MNFARLALLLPLAVGLLLAPPARSEEKFPEPESLRSAVSFWMRVYLEVTTRAGLLHDSSYPGIVYEAVRLESEGRRARQRAIDARKRHWRETLTYLSQSRPPRSERERAVVRLFEIELGRVPTARDFSRAARRIRFQLGQRDKFRDGIIRSGAYEDEMRAIFREKGLPEDLAYLPHVESSFNTAAYSKYGAAGVWQFMRSTARRYMKVDYVVDERLDPLRATRAAADLLRDNYRSLGSWPLAITAYNHGAAGMRRAKRRLGTDDIGVIVDKYKSRTFGFASRNFYAQFLAGRRILSSYPSYFGPLQRAEPEVVDTIALPFYADVGDVRTHLGIEPAVLGHLNPALRPTVFRGNKRIPKNYTLRLPAGTIAPNPAAWLASLPGEARHAKATRRAGSPAGTELASRPWSRSTACRAVTASTRARCCCFPTRRAAQCRARDWSRARVPARRAPQRASSPRRSSRPPRVRRSQSAARWPSTAAPSPSTRERRWATTPSGSSCPRPGCGSSTSSPGRAPCRWGRAWSSTFRR